MPTRNLYTCAGCQNKVWLDPAIGWVNDLGPCRNPLGHSWAMMDKLGRAFHDAGRQALEDTGMDRVLELPPYDSLNDLQRLMVQAGVTAVVMELDK